MLKGQCLCGKIQYIYHRALNHSILCFCQDCHRAQGGFLGWNSPIEKLHFEIVSGSELLKSYFHTPKKARVFCAECGSPLYSYRLDLPDILRLRLGSVVEGEIPAPNELFYTHDQPKFLQIKS